MTASLADAVAVFRGNPFTDSGIAARTRLGRLLLTSSAARAIRGALRGEVAVEPEGLVLAVAHARACGLADPGAVLSPAVLPDPVAAELPRPRDDYARIGFAAARCYRALEAWPGRSVAVRTLRQEGWQAALGEDLTSALDLEWLRRQEPVVVCGEPGSGREALARAVLAGLPALAGRQPWSVPEILSWDPPGAVPADAALLVRDPDRLGADGQLALAQAVRGASHRRLALLCAPWRSVAGRLHPELRAVLVGRRLEIPALRDRGEDLGALSLSWLVSWSAEVRRQGGFALDFGPAMQWLAEVESQDRTRPDQVLHLQAALRTIVLGGPPPPSPVEPPPGPEDLPPGLAAATWSERQVKDWYLRRVHRRTGAVGSTARILGLDRSTVRGRLRIGEGT